MALGTAELSTYDVPPAAKRLSFGKLLSISIIDKSRGKSKGILSSEITASELKTSSHEALLFRELAVLFVTFDPHPMHVIPETPSPVEN
jgi:hypothetical protein